MVKRSATEWVARGAMLIALGLAGVLWSGFTAHAFNPQFDPPTFGLVGITSSETVRLGVVCSQQATPDVATGPCRGTLMFIDTAGVVRKRGLFSLEPGQATFLDFPASEATFGDQIRDEMQPAIMPAPGSGRVIPSVQVFDTASGKTSAYVVPIPRLSFFEPNRGPATMGAPGR